MADNTQNKHVIWTLEDIARLPKDTRGRLMKELPDIVDAVAGWMELLEKTAETLPEDKRSGFIAENMTQMPGMITWVDDGHHGCEVTIRAKDEEGNEALYAHGDSRTRDVELRVNGEDQTHNAMLVSKMAKMGIVLTEDNHKAILPPGQVVLDDEMLSRIETFMSPATFADIADAADRKIIIVADNMGAHDERWKHHADIQ